MTIFPEVQSKAQSELDRVVGQNQLPSFNDQDNLPYLAAVLREVQRYFVVGPLSVPHMLEKDDKYRGYHLPGGSVVIANTWYVISMTSGSSIDDIIKGNSPRRTIVPKSIWVPAWAILEGWQDRSGCARSSESCIWVRKAYLVRPYASESDFYAKEITGSPGIQLAKNAIWITAGYILATFRIEKALDSEGKVLEPSGNGDDGLVKSVFRTLVFFKCLWCWLFSSSIQPPGTIWVQIHGAF